MAPAAFSSGRMTATGADPAPNSRASRPTEPDEAERVLNSKAKNQRGIAFRPGAASAPVATSTSVAGSQADARGGNAEPRCAIRALLL